MPGNFLLDTNIVIALFDDDSAVRQRLGQADLAFLPVVVLGELFYGARKSAHPEQNIARVLEFASEGGVIDCDATTADHYGRIKHELRTKGRPIPENDIWIASVARQYDLTLASRDEHFQLVEGVSVERW